jgi:hypothetical protein
LIICIYAFIYDFIEMCKFIYTFIGLRKTEEKKRNKSVRKSNGIILGNIGQEVRESLTGSQDEMDESHLKSCID